jgi:hypothetical protein
MEMLRSKAAVALDEVTEACRAAADHFQSLADAERTGEMAELFRALASEHHHLAARMEGEIRRQGNLPSRPDPDREAVEHLVTRVRAALSGDGHRVLLEESQRVESALAARIEAAFGWEQPPRVRLILEQMRHTVEATAERLAAATEG